MPDSSFYRGSAGKGREGRWQVGNRWAGKVLFLGLLVRSQACLAHHHLSLPPGFPGSSGDGGQEWESDGSPKNGLGRPVSSPPWDGGRSRVPRAPRGEDRAGAWRLRSDPHPAVLLPPHPEGPSGPGPALPHPLSPLSVLLRSRPAHPAPSFFLRGNYQASAPAAHTHHAQMPE